MHSCYPDKERDKRSAVSLARCRQTSLPPILQCSAGSGDPESCFCVSLLDAFPVGWSWWQLRHHSLLLGSSLDASCSSRGKERKEIVKTSWASFKCCCLWQNTCGGVFLPLLWNEEICFEFVHSYVVTTAKMKKTYSSWFFLGSQHF